MKKLKENNLSKLYNYLQLGGKYSTQDLAKKFSLSERTIQGYLKELREEYGLKKEKKLYYFADSYRHIDTDEKVQMSTALMISLYKNAIPVMQESVLQNFKQIPKEVDAFLFDIDFQAIKNETFFNQVTNAIINEKAIHFKYKDTKNKTSFKNIQPLKITNVLTYWYLMGYDLEKSKVKTFYFNNISELSLLKDENYLSTQKMFKLSHDSFKMSSPWFNDDKQTVQLKVSGEAMLYMQRQKSHIFKILKKEQSLLIVEMDYYSEVEVLSFVKKWLPSVDILNNDTLNKQLYTMLQTYLLK